MVLLVSEGLYVFETSDMTDRSSAERSDEGSNGSEGNTRPVGAVDGSPNAGEMRHPSASAQVPPHREHSVSNGGEEGRNIDEEGVTSTIEDNARQGPSSGISVEQMRVPVMAQSPSSLHKTPSGPHRAESGGEKNESGRISLQAQEKHSEVVRGEGRRRHSKDEISGEDQRSSEDEGRMEKQRKGHRGHRERRREEGEDEKRNSGHGKRREESRRSSSGERRQYDGDREKSRRKRNRDEKRNKRSNEERNNEGSPSPKRKERTEKRRTEEFDEGAHNKASPKMDNAEKVEQVSKEKKEPLDLLRTRTGGAYIPPAKLKMLQEQIADKNSEQYQRMNWERLKKKIHGQDNAEKVEQVSKEKKEPLDLLRTRTGGAYIPPAKLKMLQEQIADKNSEQYQRMNWERLKKKIHGQ
uniref:Pre-mRNA-splicing factor CWC25 homolog n=1 Tax=Ascaris lumbricoides TaxID=6252 RepID=A0A0M3IA76_ASCLU